MSLRRIGSLVSRTVRTLRQDPDRFLRRVSGVVHVGANTGQERERYARLGLRVLWIEAIPAVFEQLEDNLRGFGSQRAIQSLVTDRDDDPHRFHISNNRGESSSIFDFKYHRDIWPEVDYVDAITLTSVTLTTLFRRERLDPSEYQALIMDTQGSELLVLKGGVPLLPYFRYVKTEVADFESYAGCCQRVDLDDFMTRHGYREMSSRRFASRAAGGSYFDVVYRRLD